MKGLEGYIKKHGKHFTEELAYKVAGKKYSARQVEKEAQRRVYYNVIGFTIGDMVYLTNVTSTEWKFSSIRKSINYTIYIMGDYRFHDGVFFEEWLDELKEEKVKFDFTPYI